MSRYVDIFKEIVDIIHKERQDWQHILDIASIIEIENLNGELQTFKFKDYELISTNLKPIFLM